MMMTIISVGCMIQWIGGDAIHDGTGTIDHVARRIVIKGAARGVREMFLRGYGLQLVAGDRRREYIIMMQWRSNGGGRHHSNG